MINMIPMFAIIFCLMAATIFVDKSIASSFNTTTTTALMARPKYNLKLSNVVFFEWGPECLYCGMPSFAQMKCQFESWVPTSTVIDIIPVCDYVAIISMEIDDPFYGVVAAKLIKEVYDEDCVTAGARITSILYVPHIPDKHCDGFSDNDDFLFLYYE